MLQTYVLNVSPISNVFCSKCFMLQVFSLTGEISEHRQRKSQCAGEVRTSMHTSRHGHAAAREQ
jgi:hypothetical protein